MLSASRSDSGPPRRLVSAVALVAGATLVEEILVTRLSSVLFYYHFSFFSIALVMSGLVIGGLVAARTTATDLADGAFLERLSSLAGLFAAGVLTPILVAVRLIPAGGASPSVLLVVVYSLLFLPGLVAAGAFLARAFSRRDEWIDRLYGSDLLGAAAGCIVSIFALRALGGPGAFLLPVVLSTIAAGVLTASARKRSLYAAAAVVLSSLAAVNLLVPLSPFRLRSDGKQPMLERWNEHSRIVATDVGGIGRYLVIDRTAGTLMPRIPPKARGKPVDIDPAWNKGSQYAVYHTGRRVRRAAIIGVGGGFDLLAALASGAKEVHGYELNRTFIDLLEHDFRDFNAITSRPELRLFHTEARVGIAHSGKHYDVIQASLIDTWAATASGGFVLSENNLYTREAWRTFLEHLTDTGVLTMTRWYIPSAPAETLRLVSLAAAALEDAGYRDTPRHLVLLRSTTGDAAPGTASEVAGYATILVSKTPFDAKEVASLREWGAPVHTGIVAAPDVNPDGAELRGLLAAETRAETIEKSQFDITPPSDERPYFFLQVRPRDFANLFRQTFGEVTEITFNGIRVLLILCASALVFVAGITAVTLRTSTSTTGSAEELRMYRRMILYFLGIGAGYIAVQLGLHQRLIIALGHPTLALSVVLFGMLLGTGLGATLSSKVVRAGRPAHAALTILAALVPVFALERFASHLERVDSSVLRIAISGATVALVGAALGLAFPVGVRKISSLGDKAVQHAWAMNGAASIAASALSALVGITWGSTGVLAFGVLFYAGATAAAWPIGNDAT
jgi:hypothetical protein